MKIKKTVIVGGVAGGASTATRLRRLDEDMEIVMFEKDEHISFANCGLPYYIGGVIEDRAELLVQTPQSMNASFNIDVRNFSRVTGINPDKKTVVVESKDRGVYEESYDKLVLAPGAKALRPNISGIDHSRIMTLRNIADTDKIKSVIDGGKISSAIVIGGGYVGVEMAENLIDINIDTSLVEAAPHILAPFDSDMVVIGENKLRDHGIKLILEDPVESFKDIDGQVEVILASGKKLVTDLVILSIGVSPDTGFLQDSGLDFGPRGHILVNEKMETNLEGVYVVGDAVEVIDFTSKQKTAIPLAGPANKQGRIVADNITGIPSVYKGSQGTSILKIFELTAANTGANERTLKKAGMDYHVIYSHPASHATYYPGATNMTIKFIFNNDGDILGAQAMGYDGVDKRIDVIATAIRLGAKVSDLTEIDLSYAPPYSAAKDPVNMLGYIAENVIDGLIHVTTWDQLENMDNYTLVDVRTKLEVKHKALAGSVNIPVSEIRTSLDKLDKNKTIVLYCAAGIRAYNASRILSQKGFKTLVVNGGINE